MNRRKIEINIRQKILKPKKYIAEVLEEKDKKPTQII